MNDCPLPASRYDHVAMGHGGGGRLTADLIARVFLRAYGNEVLSALEDQATVPAGGARIAITTDAFVVRPLFFPGGDIGRLAVCGTVNDLAVGGARPLYLTAAFVLEEGFPLADLERIALSVRDTCALAGVRLVAGDTKVVDRGKGDGVYITTTGVGAVPDGLHLSIAAARPGDRILVSGPVGDHGVAILALREGIELETELASDCAPVTELAQAVLAAAPATRCMRDPTRGGLATVLCELASASAVAVRLDERSVPVRDEVRGACELLGLDPLYVACEGRLVAVVPADQTDAALESLSALAPGAGARVIGEVAAAPAGQVIATTVAGGERLVPLLSGEQLPRIC
ncbi:MAG TPA: hydrogenase expression/formation protein HypE [Kofleriaceae bacterium]